MAQQHNQQAASQGQDDWLGTLSLVLGVVAGVTALWLSGWMLLLAVAGGALASTAHQRVRAGTAYNGGVVTAAGILNAGLVLIGVVLVFVQLGGG